MHLMCGSVSPSMHVGRPLGDGTEVGGECCCTWGPALVPSTCPQNSGGPRNLSTHTPKRFCSFPVFFPQPTWCPSPGSGPGPAAADDAMFLQGERQGQESPAHRMSATPPSGHDASSLKGSSRTKRLSLSSLLNLALFLAKMPLGKAFVKDN